MASSVPTQIGTTVLLGFGGFEYSLIQTEDVAISAIGEEQVIKDSNNATMTVIVFNPGTKYDYNGIVLGASVPTTVPIGTIITVNSIKQRVTKWDLKLVRADAKLSLSTIKENSMVYA